MKTYKDFIDENFEPHDEGVGSIAKGFKRKIHKTIDKWKIVLFTKTIKLHGQI